MKKPSSTKNSSAKMTVTSRRPNPIKVKKTIGTSKITITKTASSGIKHQVILPKTSTVVASSSSSSSCSSSTMSNNSQISSPPRPLQTINTSFTTNTDIATHTSTSTPTPTPSPLFPFSTDAVINTKKNGVWYLGGNHVVKLLTSVDGDLDHAVLSKLAAVPTVIGELALSVESLVSDDITVGGFENDLLAKIASNTLTAKRGIMAAAAAAAAAAPAASSSTSSVTSTAAVAAHNHNNNAQAAAPYANNLPSAPAVTGQVPNPLLANYQPVPNPLAIRITPPASPHLVNTSVSVSVTGQQQATTSPKTKAIHTEMPMIQAR